MTNKTEALRVRVTEEEGKAFKKFAEDLGETRARILRKMIREAVNQNIDLLHDEKSLLMVAIRQLVGIANNLNQITAAMHSGKTHRSIDETYLAEVKKCILEVRVALEDLIRKTKSRWIKR